MTTTEDQTIRTGDPTGRSVTASGSRFRREIIAAASESRAPSAPAPAQREHAPEKRASVRAGETASANSFFAREGEHLLIFEQFSESGHTHGHGERC